MTCTDTLIVLNLRQLLNQKVEFEEFFFLYYYYYYVYSALTVRRGLYELFVVLFFHIKGSAPNFSTNSRKRKPACQTTASRYT